MTDSMDEARWEAECAVKAAAASVRKMNRQLDEESAFNQFTLGEPYTSADMYRDMGIEPPRIPDGVQYVDTVRTVTVRIGEGEKP